ncbi:MAG: hypothetical protein Q9223_006851, partial [Gallowayella weberi]
MDGMDEILGEYWNYLEDRTAKNIFSTKKEFRKRYNIPPLDPRLRYIRNPLKKYSKPKENKEASKNKASLRRSKGRSSTPRELDDLLESISPDLAQSLQRSKGRFSVPRKRNAKRRKLSESIVNS